MGEFLEVKHPALAFLRAGVSACSTSAVTASVSSVLPTTATQIASQCPLPLAAATTMPTPAGTNSSDR